MSTFLGIDYGRRKTGIALSDQTKTIATGKRIIKTEKTQELIGEISAICLQYSVEKIIIGYPINLKGEKTKQTFEVETFAENLRKVVSIPIELLDERFTTKQAIKERIHHKKKVDDDILSAEILLQNYLDRLNREIIGK